MNYRHAYHAGNLCDVVKHVILARLITYLTLKDKPFKVLDSHAGLGRYALNSVEALKTNEAERGYLSLRKHKLSSFFDPFLKAQSETASYLGKDIYAGSGEIIARLTRPHDKVFLNEFHPTDFLTLKINYEWANHVKVYNRDAYETIKSFIPFAEKRGLILIDPPFEVEDEEALLLDVLAVIQQKAANHMVCVWYPIKEIARLNFLLKGVRALAFEKAFNLTFLFEPINNETLTGTGLILINPPFTLRDEVMAVRAEWLAALELNEGVVRYDAL